MNYRDFEELRSAANQLAARLFDMEQTGDQKPLTDHDGEMLRRHLYDANRILDSVGVKRD